MELPIYVVDAFTKHAFAGNPAGVCILDSPVSDEWMQNVAAEMKHAETAFLQARDSGFQLRWFTPTIEVDLCGHATLASAHILWESGRLHQNQTATFETRSGILTANRVGELIQLDFPSDPPVEKPVPWNLETILGAKPIWYGESSMDMLVELADEHTVRSLTPDLNGIRQLGNRGLMVTASGSTHDFISRFFAPQFGIDEDSVTGSAHCCLGPYWSAKLGKQTLEGYQASHRGGLVRVSMHRDRALLSGHAVTILEGVIRC